MGEYLLEGLYEAARLAARLEAVPDLEGEPWEAPRLELEWARVAPAPPSVCLSGLAAVLLRGEEALLDSSRAAAEVLEGRGLGRGIAGLRASAHSSRVIRLSPSESILLMIEITSPSVAMKPLSLRKDWMFLWLSLYSLRLSTELKPAVVVQSYLRARSLLCFSTLTWKLISLHDAPVMHSFDCLPFKEGHNLSLEGGHESVVAAHVVGGALGGSASQVLVLAGKQDLVEPIILVKALGYLTR